MALKKCFTFFFVLFLSFNIGVEAKNSGNEYLCKLIDEGNVEKVIKSIKKRHGKTRMAYYDNAIAYAQKIGNEEVVSALYEFKDDEDVKEKPGFFRRLFPSVAPVAVGAAVGTSVGVILGALYGSFVVFGMILSVVSKFRH